MHIKPLRHIVRIQVNLDQVDLAFSLCVLLFGEEARQHSRSAAEEAAADPMSHNQNQRSWAVQLDC